MPRKPSKFRVDQPRHFYLVKTYIDGEDRISKYFETAWRLQNRAEMAAAEDGIDAVFVLKGNCDLDNWTEDDLIQRCESVKFVEENTGVVAMPTLAGKVYTVREPLKEAKTIGEQKQVYTTWGHLQRATGRNKKRKKRK
jgi:hypothetical protein